MQASYITSSSTSSPVLELCPLFERFFQVKNLLIRLGLFALPLARDPR